ncbi:NAD(P)-binding protein [Neofusicoccum parvum]|nr:NAD(P)-binding protein [Neofusicoccum parvum]
MPAGTGWVSDKFAKDLVLSREDARASHVIKAVGTSSVAKGSAFLDGVFADSSASRPALYTDYADVYADPDVDIVYIGTPHALHKANCLDAIAAGKHVLCEKPFTVNEDEAREVVAAAKAKGVFLMEAMWTRFFPLFGDLRKAIHSDRVIGQVRRVFCDFSLAMDLEALPPTSRLKDPSLGAGALLDIGIYSLTWGFATLDPNMGDQAAQPKIDSSMTVVDDIDHAESIILNYTESRKMGILTASTYTKTPETFCRVEGSDGVITLSGPAASLPRKIIVCKPDGTETVKEYNHAGLGFFYEADSVALDLAAGRKESEVMPLTETLRILRIMDDLRRSNGLRYPQDK